MSATVIFFCCFVVQQTWGFAGALEQNMMTLGKNFKMFNKADNQNDALKALDNMKAAALDAKKVKLKAHDAKAPSSDTLYSQLLAEIEKNPVIGSEWYNWIRPKWKAKKLLR